MLGPAPCINTLNMNRVGREPGPVRKAFTGINNPVSTLREKGQIILEFVLINLCSAAEGLGEEFDRGKAQIAQKTEIGQ